MRHRFLQKVELPQIKKFNPEDIFESIRGIKKLITRFKRDAMRSNIPDYVTGREEKIDKLKLILVDLKTLL